MKNYPTISESEFSVKEISISYKKRKLKLPIVTIGCSLDSANFLKSIWNKKTLDLSEQFVALYLDHARDVISYQIISTGGTTSSVIDNKIILAVALKLLASTIVLAHNHPSGTLRPNDADILITNRIKQAANYLNVEVLDHIILAESNYFSFADNGLLA